MKTLHSSIIAIIGFGLAVSLSYAPVNAQAQNSQYPHGIGSNSSALYNSVGLSYQQCQNKIGDELQKTADSLDRGKAVALALTSPEFQSKVSGHKYALTIVSTNDTWDNSLCGDVKLTAVGVGFNLLDTPDTYIESIGVAEDPSLSKVSEVSTTITPICHDNCPPASPPAAWSDFIPDIDSDFFPVGQVVPNATLPVGINIANAGNSTLYDVHLAFVDSPLLQNFQTANENFTLLVGEEKTISGTVSLPSQISNVSSTLNWMIYAKNQNGVTGSKEFQRVINLANNSWPEGARPSERILPPLKQDVPVNDILCKTDLQLIIKMEDNTPACVTPTTRQKLIERGWGESLENLLATPLKIEITGLNQSYVSGQPITAMVKYTGYEHGGVYPDMEILDSNGTQVWSNCCIAHTETSGMTFGTFTYTIEGPAGKPVINETGTYTMIASLDNKTASAKFDVIPIPSIQQNNTGTVNIGNQTFYFTTLNDTLSSYHGVGAIPFTFSDVNFTLFPSVFSAGPPGSCGDTNFGSEVKFTDGTYERLSVHIPGHPCSENYTETVLSNHKNPQAGLEDYYGKIRLLVSEENQTSSVESTACDTPYSPKTSYQSPLYSNGTILHRDYTTVFYMPMNSTGKMCVHYSNPNFQAPAGIDVFPANDLMKQANITTSASPSVINTGNSTIVYTIKTGNMAGFYGIRLFCGGMPFAVGYDNQSRIVSSDFPWLGSTFYCPMLSYSFDITGLSGIGIYYITTVSHEQLDYDVTNATVASAHPNADIQNVTFSVHIRTFAKPANFWFDYKDSTISEFNSNPGFKQTTDPCNWEPAYHNSVGNFPWLGVVQINDNPLTIPPWSNDTYTFSILAKGLPSGYYGFNPVIYGKIADLPPERAGTNYIAYDYPITIGVGHIMDPSGICSR